MNDIYKHISLTIKSLRKERGWSLDKTAEETGVSKAMLGQIEREESSPTIATLWKIAAGFSLPFSHFIAEESVMRTPQPLHQSEKSVQVATLLPYDEALHMEVFLLELAPFALHLSEGHTKGILEDVIVASGSVEILTDGSWKNLKEGDALRFDATKPHGYRNSHTKIARIHNIIHYGLSKH